MDPLVTTGIFLANVVIGAVAGTVAASFKIGQYKNKVDNLETTIGRDEHAGLRKTVGEVNAKVIACETRLDVKEPLGRRKSPVSLTGRGNSFLENSGGRQFVDDNFTELLGKVDELDPKTAYDVQEDSQKVIERLVDDERINPIKIFLFKDGSTWEDAVFVMGIYLRDSVLKHKNWNVDDIDQHEDEPPKV